MKRDKKDNKRFFEGKKAQVFGISFGVIFSIILIVFILVVAGIAINHFLVLKKCTQIGLFINELQNEIDKAWNSQKSSFEFKGQLPSSLEYVCFANLSSPILGGSLEKKVYEDISLYEGSEGNMFFYPKRKACDVPYVKIKHIDLNKITRVRNPYCIAVEEKVVIKIEKGFNEGLVTLK